MTEAEFRALEPREQDAQPRQKHPIQEHRGIRYYLNVGGYFEADGGPCLHRVLWEEAFGPIPPDHDIHHIDDDRRNNNITNLAMMTHGAHTGHHNRKHRKLPVRPKTWCQTDDCDRQAKARGLCTKHYQRARAEERGHWL